MNSRFILTLAVLLLTSVSVSAQQKRTRDQMVREDREKVTSEGFWIYNDLEAASEQAKLSGKPILVVLRCIPCEECVKLDDDLVDQDPVLRPLLEQFVCVRNGLPENGMGLRIQHVGQYGADAAAKNAGFQKDEVVVTLDGRSDLMTDSDVLRYGVTANKPGDFVTVKIIRAGKPQSLKLPIQN